MNSHLSRIAMLILAPLLFLGCSGEDPNPELKDPIYKDLSSEYKKHQKQLEDAEKALVEIKKELDTVESRSLDRKIKAREYQKGKKAIIEIEQMVEYYRVKSELRRVYGRKAYRIAFKKGEEWPDPQEYKDYETNKRLRNAPRNWSHRVPKSKHQQISEEDMKKGE